MSFNIKLTACFACLTLIASLSSCRSDSEDIIPSTPTVVTHDSTLVGFYLLNEGNMGSNKCTLDWYDALTGIYHKNIFAERNPSLPQELGDVGNDIQRYGSKLYAVVNCSHFVEVMDLDAHHITQISIPNCRYIAFHDGFAYVTSYAGPVQLDPNARLGYVAKIDTTTLTVVATCTVGYQPDELVVSGEKIYVANSGGYRFPAYDHTISVIDLASFTEERQIDVAINLHRIRTDHRGRLWVTSRGDYYDTPSQMFCLDDEQITYTFPHAVSDFDIVADTLYYYATEWSYVTYDNTISYGKLDIRTHQLLSTNFITDGTDQLIQVPYGIRVNPTNGDIYLTDAGNYVTPGRLYCFDREGRRKWDVTTGDIPAHFCMFFK